MVTGDDIKTTAYAAFKAGLITEAEKEATAKFASDPLPQMSSRSGSEKIPSDKELTLAEINGKKLEEESKNEYKDNDNKTEAQPSAAFKIVAGEDSDSIFEDNF